MTATPEPSAAAASAGAAAGAGVGRSGDKYPQRAVSAMLKHMGRMPPPRLVNVQLALALLNGFTTEKDGSHCISVEHRAALDAVASRAAAQLGRTVDNADTLGGRAAVMAVVEESAMVARRRVNATSLLSDTFTLLPLTNDANSGIDLRYRLACQRLEEVQRVVETLLTVRKYVRVTLDKKEDTAIDTLCPHMPEALRTGNVVPSSRTPWLQAFVPTVGRNGPEMPPSPGVRGEPSKPVPGVRLAVVLGQSFLLFAQLVSDGRRVRDSIGATVQLLPLHNVQSRLSPTDERTLVVRAFSSKPVAHGWREPVPIAGPASDYALSVWQMSLVLDSPDMCHQLHSHIASRRERLLDDKFGKLVAILEEHGVAVTPHVGVARRSP